MTVPKEDYIMYKEDAEYFNGMAVAYGEVLENIKKIMNTTDWINIGIKQKNAIQKICYILQNNGF